MLAQGILLLVAGMGTVFVFLCIMVLLMMAVGVYFKANADKFLEKEAPKQEKQSRGPDLSSVVAAIAVSLTLSGKSKT
jgi:sodium pump decarboxylase gamma subunit